MAVQYTQFPIKTGTGTAQAVIQIDPDNTSSTPKILAKDKTTLLASWDSVSNKWIPADPGPVDQTGSPPPLPSGLGFNSSDTYSTILTQNERIFTQNTTTVINKLPEDKKNAFRSASTYQPYNTFAERQNPPGSDPEGGNPATGTESQPLDSDQQKAIEDDLKTIRSRNDYGKNTPIIYPIGLNSKYQDCIKFSIVKYQQSGLKGFGKGNENLRRVVVEGGIPKSDKEREIIGTIVLPIPGGIQDGNQVDWSGSTLSDLAAAAGNFVQKALTGGDAVSEAQRQAEAAAAEGSGVRSAIVSKTTEGAIGKDNLMQRQYGAIINPNLELLFNSPFLRTFTFSFKLSPRSKDEAVIVKKIIRTFKQAMSVKRSTSSFLLQSPHTFAISYIFQDKQHPYLNKFKECALTNCSVNYTPEGNYMAFDDSDDPSMVSYQLDLQFQELEPLYDDDYGEGWSDIGY